MYVHVYNCKPITSRPGLFVLGMTLKGILVSVGIISVFTQAYLGEGHSKINPLSPEKGFLTGRASGGKNFAALKSCPFAMKVR